ncbi:MAG: hypothetical protein NUK62_05190 [Tenericutes bacterium]|nr:hypothetical protein [Mycoplasmatota bacterium]
MLWLPILLTVIGLFIATLIIMFLVKRNKTYLIPSVLLLMISLTLIGLSQTVDTSGGGWEDVIYTIFGVFFFIVSIIMTLIVLLIRAYRKNKN